MNAYTLSSLIVITDLLIHKYLTSEESFALQELSDKLISTEKTLMSSKIKIIESFGGKNDGQGNYSGMEDTENLKKALDEANGRDLNFTTNTHILSMNAITKNTQVVELSTSQIRLMKEYLLKEELPKVEES